MKIVEIDRGPCESCELGKSQELQLGHYPDWVSNPFHALHTLVLHSIWISMDFP